MYRYEPEVLTDSLTNQYFNLCMLYCLLSNINWIWSLGQLHFSSRMIVQEIKLEKLQRAIYFYRKCSTNFRVLEEIKWIFVD